MKERCESVSLSRFLSHPSGPWFSLKTLLAGESAIPGLDSTKGVIPDRFHCAALKFDLESSTQLDFSHYTTLETMIFQNC